MSPADKKFLKFLAIQVTPISAKQLSDMDICEQQQASNYLRRLKTAGMVNEVKITRKGRGGHRAEWQINDNGRVFLSKR